MRYLLAIFVLQYLKVMLMLVFVKNFLPGIKHVYFVGKGLFSIFGGNCQTLCARIEKYRDINQKFIRKFYHDWIITVLVLLSDVTFCSTFRKIRNRKRA